MKPTSRVLILFLLAAALRAAGAGALSPPWVPLGPFGGGIGQLTADPTRPGTLYATTGTGIYKTVDGGLSWSSVYLGTPSSGVAIDPVHPAVLYAGVQEAVLVKSTDGGAHWAPAATGLSNGQFRPIVKVAVDPANPNRLLAEDDTKVWRSLNAGASWQPAINGLPGDNASIHDLVAAGRPAGTAFVATTAGVYRTVDGGASWRAAAGLPAEQAFSLAVAPSDPRTVYADFGLGTGLYKTTNGGASWQAVGGPDDIGWSLVVSPRDPNTLYARSFRFPTLHRSTDGGRHWAQLPGPTPTVIAIAVDPARPATVYAGVVNETLGGVFRSDDSGATWTRRSEGITGLATPALAVDPSDPDHLWTETAFSFFRSANRGARWVRVPTPPGTAFFSAPQLAIGAASRVYASIPYPLSPRGPLAFRLWRTDDDGASWRDLTSSAGTFINAERFQIAPSDLSTIYTVGFTPAAPELFRSTDGGDTWELRSSGPPLPSCARGDLAVAPSSAAVVYLSGTTLDPATSQCQRSLIRSGDGGATWTAAAAGLPMETIRSLAVDPRSPDEVYAGAGLQGLWKSTDGGQSWAQTAFAGHAVTSLLASILSRRIYAVVDGTRVFRSDDGGATWLSWSRGLRVVSISALVADPGDSSRIYAATANGAWALTETD